MMNDPLPWHFSRYCIKCGAPLIYTSITAGTDQGEASWRCSGCGDESGFSWGEFSFSRDDQQPSLPADDLSLPPPPYPGNIPDLPEEYQAQCEALQQQIDAYGVAAILQAAHFPLFAFEAGYGRFLAQGHGWGGGGWSTERGPGPLLASFHLQYAGPSYKDVTERIIIEQVDRESHSWPSSVDGESQMVDTYHITQLLAQLPSPVVPSMRSLWEGDAIRQFINEETVNRAAAAHRQIELQSGEVVPWVIRQFKAPLPIAHAGALIENTRIDVGAIGPAADDLDQVLRHLSRLMPESATLGHLAQGLEAWKNYLFQHF